MFDYFRRIQILKERNDEQLIQEAFKSDTLGSIAAEHGIVSWKYLYEFNKELIGDNQDRLMDSLL